MTKVSLEPEWRRMDCKKAQAIFWVMVFIVVWFHGCIQLSELITLIYINAIYCM